MTTYSFTHRDDNPIDFARICAESGSDAIIVDGGDGKSLLVLLHTRFTDRFKVGDDVCIGGRNLAGHFARCVYVGVTQSGLFLRPAKDSEGVNLPTGWRCLVIRAPLEGLIVQIEAARAYVRRRKVAVYVV